MTSQQQLQSSNKKKLGKNLNKLLKQPPAPPITNPLFSTSASTSTYNSTNTYNSRSQNTSSSHTGLLLLSTNKKSSTSSSSSSLLGLSSKGFLISSSKQNTPPTVTTTTTTTTTVDSNIDWNTNHYLFNTSTSHVYHNDSQHQHQHPVEDSSNQTNINTPWAITAPDNNSHNDKHSKSPSSHEIQNYNIHQQHPINGYPNEHPDTSQQQQQQPQTHTNEHPQSSNNNKNIKEEVDQEDQVEYMKRLAKERSIQRKIEEEARAQLQRERAHLRLKDLEAKIQKNTTNHHQSTTTSNNNNNTDTNHNNDTRCLSK